MEKDSDDHSSLRIAEDGAAPYALVLVAPDSFASRLNREHRVAFTRRDGRVTGIKLSWTGVVRHGVKDSVRN